MRFARVHKVSVYTVAVLGLMSLASGGALQGPIGIVIAAGVIASWWAEGALLEKRAYARLQTTLLVLALGVQFARATLFGHGLLDAAVEFAALLQVSRLAYRKTAAEFQQSTALALAHLIAATVLGAGLSYALCFLGFVIALPWALTLGHLRREIEGNYLADARAGRAGVPIDVARILRSRRVVGPGLLVGSSLLSLPIFAITAVLFVLFPRIGLGVFSLRQSRGAATAGLGDEVDLAGHGTIRDDPTIVLRVEPSNLGPNPPSVRPFRLRGAAFDVYNGHAWSRRSLTRTSVLRDAGEYDLFIVRGEQTRRQVSYRLTLDGIDPPVLLLPPGTVRVRVDPRMEAGYPRYPDLTRDAANEVRYSAQDDLGLVYTAYVPEVIADDLGQYNADRSPLDEATTRRYLQLPAVSPEFLALARQLTAPHETAYDKASAVVRHLRSFRYTLDIESGGAERPVEHFLFRSHAGHCEYFSTSMALLLRAAGVPTRNVTGFLGGTYNRYGRFYAIRQGDAHSWVEVYDQRFGWITFDPTPPAREPATRASGLLSEIDAVLEALRARWRRYVVGFDLSTQLRLFQGAARWFDFGGRGRGAHQPAARSPRAEAQRNRPPSHYAFAIGGIAALGAIGWFLSRRSSLRSAPEARSVRDAIALARAFDNAVAARGFSRPSSRSLVAHAKTIRDAGAPIAELATEVADRWAAARYGAQPLTESELDGYKKSLASFDDAKHGQPPRDAPSAASASP
jgi:transglutaminase-like putative cysteine protease